MCGVKLWCLRRRYSLIVVTIVTVPLIYWSLHGKTEKKLKTTVNLSLLSAPPLYNTHHKPHRYVLGLNYWEQLTMATCNFAHLVCLGARWNADTVLPYTFNSRLYGLPNFKPDDNINETRLGQTLDIIYDVSKLGEVFTRYGLPLPVRSDEFLEKAAREVVVLHFIAEKEAHELPAMVGGINQDLISSAFRQSNIIDCANILQDYAKLISNGLNELTYSLNSVAVNMDKFKVSRYYCVNMAEMTSPRQLASKIGLSDDKDFTAIVVNWRGTSDKKTIFNSATGTHINKRITMEGMCNLSMAGRNYFEHSSLVHNAAQNFIQDLKLSQTFIAIHFRSEKIAMRGDRYPNAISTCFREVIRIRNNLLKKKNLKNSSVVYLTDSGPYSSDTCKNCRGGREMKELLQNEGIEITQFDPMDYSLPADSGVAAAVESSVLSAASYLILCGGGGFQSQVALGFLRHGSKREMFQICHSDGSIKSLTAAGLAVG